MLSPKIQEFTFPDGRKKRYIMREEDIIQALYLDPDGFLGQHPNAPRAIWIVSTEVAEQYSIIAPTFERLKVLELIEEIDPGADSMRRFQLSPLGISVAEEPPSDEAPEDENEEPIDWRSQVANVAFTGNLKVTIEFNTKEAREAFLQDSKKSNNE